MPNTKYYNEFFELGQQKINFSFLELRLPDDDPVYTLKKVMEDIDYSDLLAQYSNKGKNGFNPIMMYATVVYAAIRGIRSVEPVHLFEELQNIQDYYQIIRFRFFDRISLNIDIKDDSILQTYLPQLTIQPIVENAINHGLKDKIHDAVITISATRSDDIVYLKVSDNGCGIEEELLRELENRIAHPVELIIQQKKKHGIALSNVHHRIQLMFGNTYGIHIQSIPGEGTDVCIDYPIDYAKIIKGQNERINQIN